MDRPFSSATIWLNAYASLGCVIAGALMAGLDYPWWAYILGVCGGAGLVQAVADYRDRHRAHLADTRDA